LFITVSQSLEQSLAALGVRLILRSGKDKYGNSRKMSGEGGREREGGKEREQRQHPWREAQGQSSNVIPVPRSF
jgi:hypothetical protein